MIAGLVGAGAVLALLGHCGLWMAAYRPIVRGRRQGRWDPTPTPPQMHAFPDNAIGVAPGSAYLYAGYALRPDQALIVEGTVDEGALYASLTLYDLYLQGVPGRTHLNDTALGKVWRVVVAHEDRGFPLFLDASRRPRGVIAFRHAPGATVTVPRLQVLDLTRAQARYGRGHR
jgi:hypothetical protein